MTAPRSLVVAFALALSFATPAFAHPHESLLAEQVGHIEHQIMHMREALLSAITAKDVAKLRHIYAPSFTHTHGSGKVDGRDARIASVLAGDPVIEAAKIEELTIRVLHADTAIIAGRSLILNMVENRDYDYRWMQVWVRVRGEWQLAASQATSLPATT